MDEVNELKLDRTEKILVTWILVVLLVGVAVGIRSNDRIAALREEVPPDTAFVMLTVVEAARIDRDGNVVEKVVKSGDLPTSNWGYFFAMLFDSQNTISRLDEFNDTVLTDIGGTSRDVGIGPTWQGETGVTYPRIGWGSGSVAATINDYELNTKDDWDTVDQVVYYSNSTHMWLKVLMTHEFTGASTIREVALYLNGFSLGFGTSTWQGETARGFEGDYGDIIYETVYHTEAGGYTITIGELLGQYMVFRDVLPSQLDVPADESVTITYWIYIRYA